MLLRGPKAVMVGVTLKSRYEPGDEGDESRIFRTVSSCSAVTGLYCFSPRPLIPSNCAFWPDNQNARTAWETLPTTCAGAAGVWEKYLAPPRRPAPVP